jgi:hypothetical protein
MILAFRTNPMATRVDCKCFKVDETVYGNRSDDDGRGECRQDKRAPSLKGGYIING